MRRFLVLARREIFVYIVSPPVWIIAGLFLLVNGWMLHQNVILTEGDVRATHEFLFLGFPFWFLSILLPAVLTARLFALEKSAGTLETLMTAPVTDVEVVLAKFSAALGFLALLWSPTIVYYVLLDRFGGAPDAGVIAASYLAVIGIGALFTALGCLSSSLTANQVVAFFVTAIGAAVLLVAPMYGAASKSEGVVSVARYLSLVEHMSEVTRGVVDPRRFLYYLSGAALFLFLTVRSVEARKWK
jgi:ABC-2 type transport system permease protein